MKILGGRAVLLLSIVLFVACAGKANKPTVPAVKANSATAEVIELNENNFVNKVSAYEAGPTGWKYAGKIPCIVDFYATWCGPCKQLKPILDGLASDYKGKIQVYRVDVDKNPKLAAAFGIQSIPMLLWVPMTGKPSVTEGLLDKATLENTIKTVLLK